MLPLGLILSLIFSLHSLSGMWGDNPATPLSRNEKPSIAQGVPDIGSDEWMYETLQGEMTDLKVIHKTINNSLKTAYAHTLSDDGVTQLLFSESIKNLFSRILTGMEELHSKEVFLKKWATMSFPLRESLAGKRLEELAQHFCYSKNLYYLRRTKN